MVICVEISAKKLGYFTQRTHTSIGQEKVEVRIYKNACEKPSP
jgi:hypothetical protein